MFKIIPINEIKHMNKQVEDKWQILDEKSDSPNRYWYLIEKLNGANIEQD